MRCSNGTVGQICSLLACLFTAVNTLAFTAVNTLAIVPSTQNPSSAFLTSPLVNTTALDSTIDSRFGFKAVYGETDLPLTPCFMNVVELLGQYAELDWLSRVRQRHGAVLPSYPQVEIAVLPASPATSVEVRLAFWGLWVAVRDIINGNNFHEAEFEIFWERQVVAYIYFTKPMDLRLASNNGTLGTDESLTLLTSPNQTTDGIFDTSNSTGNTPDALNDETFTWIPIFPPTSRPLTVVEVFLTVMAGLKNAAPHGASDKVPGPYASAAIDVYANVQFYIHKRRTPRTRPPFFQYIHIIKALKMIPGYMLQKKRFSELFFSMEVSGLQVGEGYLEKGHYVPPHSVLGDVLAAERNVSLS